MLILKQKFGTSALYQVRQESMKGFLSRRWSFWLAFFSCVAFLVGNMVGQHGWNAFWKSVWGKEAAIVYEGVVPPLAGLPEYKPFQDCRDIREYDRSVYSVNYMGDYDSGGLGCGSHPAADILTPKGTPVYAIANGKISRKEERSWGFGNTLVLEFPGPDPDHGDNMTTFYAGYAHLGQMLVEEGEIISKGQPIAYSGETGFATAQHLHFQIDRPEAPFHLYWPFTTTEATEQGLDFVNAVNAGLGKQRGHRYTLDPLAYVQSYKNGGIPLVIASADYEEDGIAISASEETSQITPSEESDKTVTSFLDPKEFWKRLKERVRARREKRIARRENQRIQIVENIDVVDTSSDAEVTFLPDKVDETPSEPEEEIITELEETQEKVSTAETDIPMPKAGTVTDLSILHDGSFDKGWEDIVIFARDDEGNFVHNVRFAGELYLQASFGEADFSPSVLTEEQFDGRGRAMVRMYPRGRKTIIPGVIGTFIVQGEPMANESIVSAREPQQEGG